MFSFPPRAETVPEPRRLKGGFRRKSAPCAFVEYPARRPKHRQPSGGVEGVRVGGTCSRACAPRAQRQRRPGCAHRGPGPGARTPAPGARGPSLARTRKLRTPVRTTGEGTTTCVALPRCPPQQSPPRRAVCRLRCLTCSAAGRLSALARQTDHTHTSTPGPSPRGSSRCWGPRDIGSRHPTLEPARARAWAFRCKGLLRGWSEASRTRHLPHTSVRILSP